MLDLLISTLTQGFIYGLIAYGVFITYKILDFPDLTVDGSFPLGAAITAFMITKGANPYLTIPVSLLTGALAGFVTGMIHVKLGVRDLLAGIITMTALYSVNLQIAGSSLSLIGNDTVFSLLPLGDTKLIYRKFIFAIIIAIIVKIVLDLYFKTKSGLMLRGAGDNPTFITTLAKDSGKTKIMGLSISNALVALAGCMVCQEQRAFSSMMGTGQMVFALAAVLIGITVFKHVSWIKGTTAAVIGSIIYKLCIQGAIQIGMPANLLNLISAALFLIILAVGSVKKKKKPAKSGEVKNNA